MLIIETNAVFCYTFLPLIISSPKGTQQHQSVRTKPSTEETKNEQGESRFFPFHLLTFPPTHVHALTWAPTLPCLRRARSVWDQGELPQGSTVLRFCDMSTFSSLLCTKLRMFHARSLCLRRRGVEGNTGVSRDGRDGEWLPLWERDGRDGD